MVEEQQVKPEEVGKGKKVKIPSDPSTFRMYMRAALGVVVLLYGGAYLWTASFHLEGDNSEKYIDIILGFIIGTALTMILSFYFGSSEGNGATKTTNIENVNQ